MMRPLPLSTLFPYTTLFRSTMSTSTSFTPSRGRNVLWMSFRMRGPAGQPGEVSVIEIWTTSTRRCRSEEHTSELQSRLHLVCRLLLEKKKKKKQSQNITKKE